MDKEKDEQNSLHKDPKIEEQITAAFETLSDKDKELFEDTQLIHTDRDVSVETQVHHVLKLHKRSQRKRKMILWVILILLAIGIIASFSGIYIVRRQRREEAVQNTAVPDEDNSVEVAIDSVNFPDAAFRERIITPADTNGDQKLTGDEISSIIMINLAGDARISDLTGIQYLTSLQSMDVSSTSIQSLDLSQNTELTNLKVTGDNIAILDLSKQIKLTSLDISNCSALTQLILPEPSAITSLTADNTIFQCDKNDEGIYTACRVNQ